MGNVFTVLSLERRGKMLLGFIISVAAGVVTNFISKWLDGKLKDR